MQVFGVGSWISDGHNFSAFLDVGIDDEGTSFATFRLNICDWSTEHVFVCNGNGIRQCWQLKKKVAKLATLI